MTSTRPKTHFIFATIFLDMLGVGLLIPIFPDIIRRFSDDPAEVSELFGYFISIYALMQFIASPVLGALSDRFGRRPILLTSLFAAGIDYLIMAFAPALWVVFLGRVISGLTGASMTVASAYMADVSDDSSRSRNFGLIGAAFGLGFIMGPAAGGVLGSYGWQYPFLAAASLNLLNFAFGFFILPESLPRENRRQVELAKINPLSSFAKAFRPSPILIFIMIYFLIFIAGQVHPSIWTLYTQRRFGWTAADVGFSLALVGLMAAIVQGVLTAPIVRRTGEWLAVVLGIFINSFAFLGFGLATEGWMMYAILIPSSLAGITGPALQSLIAGKVPPQEQGELQGTLVAIGSLSAIFGPLIYTTLFSRFAEQGAEIQIVGAPYYCAAFISLLSGVFLLSSRRNDSAPLKAEPAA